MKTRPIAILGTGNLGVAIVRGWLDSELMEAGDLRLTRRHSERLKPLGDEGCDVGSDNVRAIRGAAVVLVSVEPQQIDGVLDEIAPHLEKEQVLISVASGVSLAQIRARVGAGPAVVRAMPNTAVSICESMTCLAAEDGSETALEVATMLFDAVGTTLVIDEEQMTSATALAACGIAFFLRAIRAASQGGIEIGIHSSQALKMAAQTAKGAASLLLAEEKHPEFEIDRVTTPRGCTIAGLNQMEHGGFSSAMIRGITTSAAKAGNLYEAEKKDGQKPVS